MRRSLIFCATASLLLVVAAVLLLGLGVFHRVLRSKISQRMVLKPNSKAFKNWKEIPAMVEFEVYLFHCVNPREVLAGERPVLQQRGPYTYRERLSRQNVIFHENNTVSATLVHTYNWIPELSVGSPMEDKIMMLNVPLVAAIEKVQAFGLPSLVNILFSFLVAMKSETLFTSHSVHELLWGYEDPLLVFLNRIDPLLVPDTHFGFFYKRNGSNDGRYDFNSGKGDFYNFSRIELWKGMRTLPWWTSDSCNAINGTDGTSFRPMLSRKDVLYMFNSELCRSIYATYEQELTVAGLWAFRFTPPASVFANASTNPANAGFCTPTGNCLGSGVLNVSVCKQGAPIIMSSPHFYQADPQYVNSVEGLKPNKQKHQTFIDIHPYIGFPVRAAKRLQVNVHVQKWHLVEQTGNIRTLVFPVMFLSENMELEPKAVGELAQLQLQISLLLNIPYILIALAGLFALVAAWLACRHARATSRDSERTPLVVGQED
uniref:Scavenger receptor class B, member 2a n=2 Tax=Eptatretus burgeri TaxID=7764 RepID=A0A8C4PYY2_EPTBU